MTGEVRTEPGAGDPQADPGCARRDGDPEPRCDDPPPFRVVASDVPWSCPWFSIRREAVLLADGSPGTWHALQKGDGVWVVPILPDGRIVLVRNWRQTVGAWCHEVPAGTRKDGDVPEETARAELREEAGGTAGTLVRIGGFYTAPGVLDETGHLFVALDVVLADPEPEPTECLTRWVVGLDEAERMALDGRMADAPSALAVLRAADWLRRR